MNLSISGHHLVVTPALREYVTNKLERIRHHFDHVIDVGVILSVEKLQQKAEIALRVTGKHLYAESIDTDLYAAIDSLIDKLDRQIIKYKKKRHGHLHEAIKHQAVTS